MGRIKQETINYNNIKHNTQVLIDELINKRPLLRWDSQTQTNKPIKYINNKIHSWHFIINPRTNTSPDELIKTFNYIKNRYGKFRYGKRWTELLNLDFELIVEKESYYHLHILFRKVSTYDMAILFNYFSDMLDFIYKTNSTKASTSNEPAEMKNKLLELFIRKEKDQPYICKQLDDKSNHLNTRYYTPAEIKQLMKVLTPEQVPEYNVAGYMSKKDDSFYKSSNDFIKKKEPTK